MKKNITSIASKTYIKTLKSHDGVAMAYNLKFLPVGKDDFRIVINREFAQVTPVNKHYLCNDIEMTNLIGRKVNVKRGFVGYATMDLSAMACARNKTQRNWSEGDGNAEAAIGKYDILLGEYKGVTVAGVRYTGDDNVFIKSTKQKRNGERFVIPFNEVVDKAGNTRPGWSRFADYKIFGASKGRKHLFDLFEQNSDFERYINDATYGEYQKVLGMPLTNKETAEAVTRLGSKSCGLGSQDLPVENITIILGQDENTDGAGLISNINGLVNGYIVQERSYTSKAAGLTVMPAAMELAESHYNIVVWDKHNLTVKQERLLDIILNKCDRRLSGMSLDDIVKEVGGNAIKLVGDPTKGTQVLGDLNFWKDKWDYSRTSGLNVVDVAYFGGDDFEHAATSGQMLKLLLGCRMGDTLKDKVSRFFRGIISAEIAGKFTDKGCKAFDGREMISTSYAAGAFRTFNPVSWKINPAIYRMVLKEQINSLRDMFNRDRYHVPGHSAMATIDVAYFLTRGSMHFLNTDVNDKKITSFEVYDPAANRYNKTVGAPAEGFVVKYPSMGTKEGSMVHFVTLEEAKARFADFGTTPETLDIITTELEAFKEGGVMCPANLKVLAMILAGFDLDGDHMEIFFSTSAGMSIPQLLKAAGFIGSAINIDTPPDTNTEGTPFSAKRWVEYSAMLADMENKSVGTVTNSFRLFTDGLLQDLSDPDILGFYKKLFVAIGATHGDKNYKSIVDIVNTHGIDTYFVVDSAMTEFVNKAIKGINLDNPDNIRALLEDMDKLGRACQELTIDAQKKFFPVFCEWMDKIGDYSLFCLKYGINFTVEFDDIGNIHCNFSPSAGYTYDGSSNFFKKSATVVVEKANGRTKYTMADAFTRYRVFAINHAYRAIQKAVNEYLSSLATWKADKTDRECRLMMLNMKMNAIGIAQIKHVAKAVKSADGMRKASTVELQKLHADSSLPKKLQDKVEREINKTVNADYAAILDDISNEMRRIAAVYGIDIYDVAEYYNLTGSDPMMKVLKNERFIDMLKKSDTAIFSAPLHAPQALKDWLINSGEKTIHVVDGMFYNIDVPEPWGRDVYSDLVNGVYNLNIVDGVLHVSRPIEDFVDMSTINVDMDSRIVFGSIRGEEGTAPAELKEVLKKLINDISVDTEVNIFCDTSKRKFELRDVDGNIIANLNFGKRGEKLLGSEEPTVLSKGYGDFSGKIINNIISTGGIKYNNAIYYNFVVSIKK